MRFLPIALARAGDLHRIHGTDERLSLVNYRGALCTTLRVMELMCGGGGGGGGAGADAGDSSTSSAAREEL